MRKIRSSVRNLLFFKNAGLRYNHHSNQPFVVDIFNRNLKMRQRDILASNELLPNYNYLHKECAGIMIDRIGCITKDFDTILNIGAFGGTMTHEFFNYLKQNEPSIPSSYIESDISHEMLRLSKRINTHPNIHFVQCDNDFLPFEKESFDLVISCLDFQWVNRPEDLLKKIEFCLKPDGVVLFCMISNPSFKEIQSCLDNTLASEGAPTDNNYISPMMDGAILSHVMEKSGLISCTIDFEEFQLKCNSFGEALDNIAGMGENLATVSNDGKKSISYESIANDVIEKANKLFAEKYQNNITINVALAIAWKNGPLAKIKQSQQPQKIDADIDTLKNIDKYT